MVYPPSFIACDLETSGLDAKTDEIIEVGLVRVENGRPTATHSALVRPRRPLRRHIKRLTGLDDADFDGCPGWEAVRGSVVDFIGGAPLVGHNVNFDLGFLYVHAGFRPHAAFDTCALARIVRPDLVSYRLEAVCAALDIDYPVRHRALEDATATALLYLELCERVAALDVNLLADLAALFGRYASVWFPVFDHALKQSAAVFGAAKIGGGGYSPEEFGFADPGLDEPGDVELPAVDDLFGPSGALAGRLEAYEFRPPQLEMALSTEKALDMQEILMVEAGTGTGKSFAYLAPGVLWAKRRGERLVVSTHTVNLQDQLIGKDVPVLRRVLPPFRVCLLKGRNNYLCLRRWYEAVEEGLFEPAGVLMSARIMVWLRSTATGDRSELGLKPDEWRVWNSVAATSDGCAGSACRYYAACFVNRARRQAEQAEVIITNHSLLLSDLKTENRLLPAYGALIIDEAHHLEDVATKQLGRSVTGGDFRRWAQRIQKLGTRIKKTYPDIASSLQRAEQDVQSAAAELFRVLAEARAAATEDSEHLRLEPRAANLGDGRDVPRLKEWFEKTAGDALERLERAYRLFADQTMPGTADNILSGFELLIKDGRKALEDLACILAAEDPDHVFWMERLRGEPADCLLQSAPIAVDELLFNGLFNGLRPVVLTSATLTVDGSFGYFGRRTGIDLVEPDTVRGLQLDSPFFYRDQARLFVVNDLPPPVGGTEKAYLAGLCRGIKELVLAAGGRTLVLFTAHRVLKQVYARLGPVFEEARVDLLGHGIDGGRARLLEAFRTGERAVLFGASSFWEGVDLPGEALSCLIIVKLPFLPPYHPVTLARRELIRSRGKSDFNLLSLPQAVLRFKQGFGRLIRTSTDCGAVVVLDDRVITKRYGAQFLRSLPLAWEAAPLSAVTAKVSEFLPPPAGAGTTGDES